MVFGVIMAGGKGTRLWPEGRNTWPKQLLRIIDDRPMIQTAVERLAPLIPPTRQLVVTTKDYAQPIADALPGFPRENILAEPEGKDTAPCIGWAAVKVRERDPSGIMAIVTADHAIADEDAFRAALETAVGEASARRTVVTIGIVPTRPETGYGYIRCGGEACSAGRAGVFAVEEFVEKPSEEVARSYVEDGRYLWNSGMFIARADYMLELFSTHLPDHYRLLREIEGALGTPEEEATTADAYGRFERISIDYGIMERAADVSVVPGDFGWLDVGAWSSLDAVCPHDQNGNVVTGIHLGIDTEQCIIRSSGRLIATLGVKSLVIVETPDAVLVCTKDAAQTVRRAVQMLEDEGRGDIT